MIVTAVYEDNTVKDVTGAVRISGYDKTKGGEQKITVAYGQQTATFTINELYTITVDGIEVANGIFNQLVTITAEAEKDGKKFAGWKIGDTVISKDLSYKFYIATNMEFIKVYGEALELVPTAICFEPIISTNYDTGKGNCKFIGQLVYPSGYTIKETGIIWSGKSKETVPYLYDTMGNPMEGAQKISVPRISSSKSFACTIKGVAKGKTARAVVFAKLEKDNEIKFIFSEEKSGTNW